MNQDQDENQPPVDDEGNEYNYVTHTYQKPADAEFAKYMLEMEENIRARVLYLEGFFEDENKNLKPSENGALLNPEGLRFANRQMRHFTGKYGALANMDKERISKFTLYHDKMIRRIMLSNLVKFSPTGRKLPISTIAEVKATIVDPGYLNLTRSDDDIERHKIYDSHNVRETHQYDNNPQNKRHGIGLSW